MKLAPLLLPSLGLLAVASMGGVASFSPTLAAASAPCQPAPTQNTQVYTDNGQHYVGVCTQTGAPSVTYVQVNPVQNASTGQGSLVEGQTGQPEVDKQIWAYGPASVWLNGGGPASPTPACAPTGDNQAGYSNGNNASRELPSVYTDGGNSHAGVCGGNGRVQVNQVGSAHPVTVQGAPVSPPLP